MITETGPAQRDTPQHSAPQCFTQVIRDWIEGLTPYQQEFIRVVFEVLSRNGSDPTQSSLRREIRWEQCHHQGWPCPGTPEQCPRDKNDCLCRACANKVDLCWYRIRKALCQSHILIDWWYLCGRRFCRTA